jgi:ABC-2 type transport system permease protein
MQITGGGVDLFGLLVLAALVNLTASFWAAGIAMRLRGYPYAVTYAVLILFLAPVYVPLALLGGWVHAVARFNPFTPLVEGGRDLISGGSVDTGLIYGIALALALVFVVWAIRGLRAAERAG